MFCLPPFTLRDRTTTIALDMLGRYALTDKVFETPGWSKVVMVEPTGGEAGQADRGRGPRPSQPSKGEGRVYSHNSYKTGQTPTYD
jgi:hypothetical protein